MSEAPSLTLDAWWSFVEGSVVKGGPPEGCGQPLPSTWREGQFGRCWQQEEEAGLPEARWPFAEMDGGIRRWQV